METTSAEDIHKVIAVRLARHRIGDDVVKRVSHRIAKNGLKVGRVDFCPYGICIDYFGSGRFSLDEVLRDDIFRVVKYFPYGIPVDDMFRMQVEMHIPELAEQGIPG